MTNHEVYKMCCPKCSHVFFRLECEDAKCPVCNGATGVTVAGGRFQCEQTFIEMLQQERKEREERKVRPPACRD